MGRNEFKITGEHRRWARVRQRKYGDSTAKYLALIAAQDGRCALSGVPLIFNSAQGGGSTPGGAGCHPLYAALDHCVPGSTGHGVQIVSYALNDLKGHLPLECFRALSRTQAWRRLMESWRRQQIRNRADREAFRALLRPLPRQTK